MLIKAYAQSYILYRAPILTDCMGAQYRMLIKAYAQNNILHRAPILTNDTANRAQRYAS